jgi:lipoprotein-anchoring transpeptidase ErfK/SrfK
MGVREARAGSPRETFLVNDIPVPGWGRRALRRRGVAAAGAAVLLVAAFVALSAVRSKRDAAMRTAAGAASAALAEARANDARTWAPGELLAAEGALRDARLSQRVEEVRLWPIPDAARVAAGYEEAERAARQTQALSRDRRAVAVSATQTTLGEAAGAVSESAGLASTIHLEPARRVLLAKAQSALVEARVYEREGDLSTASFRAREAIQLAGLVRDGAASVVARYADADTVGPWRRLKEEAIAWSRREGRAAIVVAKEAHLLTLFLHGEAAKTYKVDLGLNWVADKVRAGDDATPEGRYRIVSRAPEGTFHKALLLDYPNAEDRAKFARARRSGDLPPSAAIGGLIEIHGEGGRGRDWTNGCIALANTDMDDLFARVDIGTPVTIVGSDDFGAIAEFAARYRDGGTERQR